MKGFLPGGCVHDPVDEEGDVHPGRLTGEVTFARYTGQEDRNVRQALVEHPPDILLTNCVMLELLLARVWDRNLLGNADNSSSSPSTSCTDLERLLHIGQLRLLQR